MSDELSVRVTNLSVAYVLDDRAAVEEFLTANPDLIPYVEQSVEPIRKHFPESDLRLSVEVDEDEDSAAPAAEKLFILIEVPDDVSDALGRLDRVDEEWAIDLCEATDDKLVIDLKY